MQNQPTSPQPRPRWLSTEASAWLVLSVFFVVSIGCLIGLGWLAWNYRNDALRTMDGAQLRSHVSAGVFYQEPRTLSYKTLERLPAVLDPCAGHVDTCMPLKPGYRLKVSPSVGYGPVASIVLPDQSHIQLFSLGVQSDFLYERYQVSRWTNTRQIVNFVQNAGYSRFDLTTQQPYDIVEYSVAIPDGYKVWMTPGGSYSVNVIPADPDAKPPVARMYEVAVRSGSATVAHHAETVSIAAGEKVTIRADDILPAAVAARWELITDPEWSTYTTEIGMQRESGVHLWEKFNNVDAPDMTDGERNAVLTITKLCPPKTPDTCSKELDLPALRMQRFSHQGRRYSIGLKQTLDVDVSEYRTLQLVAWVRIGAAGAEVVQNTACPLKFQLIYKTQSPSEPQQERKFCLYAKADPQELSRTEAGNGVTQPTVTPSPRAGDTKPVAVVGTPTPPPTAGTTDESVTSVFTDDDGVTIYREQPPYVWYKFVLDLRTDKPLKNAKYLQQFSIEADGLTYSAEVMQLSLLGSQ